MKLSRQQERMQQEDRAAIRFIASIHPEKLIAPLPEPEPEPELEPKTEQVELGRPIKCMADAADYIAKKYRILKHDLLYARFGLDLQKPRREFIAICVHRLGRNVTEIGKYMGKRDRTTIHHHLKQYEREVVAEGSS